MSDCETYRLTLEPLIAAQAKANESAGGKGAGKGRSAKGSQIVANPIDTRDAIAKEAGEKIGKGGGKLPPPSKADTRDIVGGGRCALFRLV